MYTRYVGGSNLSPFIAILCHFRVDFPQTPSKAIQLPVCSMLPSDQTLSTSWFSSSLRPNPSCMTDWFGDTLEFTSSEDGVLLLYVLAAATYALRGKLVEVMHILKLQ